MASVTPTPSCVYKSVTLAAGEQFTLPPGAELVASSAGIAAVKSTCALPDTLEEPVCYKFKFSGGENENSSSAQNWEQDDNFKVKGIFVNGLYYPFANLIQLGGLTSSSSLSSTWLTALNSIPQFNGLFTFLNGNPQYGNEGAFGNGFTLQVAFSVIPSVGDSFEFVSFTSTQYQAPFSGEFTEIYTKGVRC